LFKAFHQSIIKVVSVSQSEYGRLSKAKMLVKIVNHLLLLLLLLLLLFLLLLLLLRQVLQVDEAEAAKRREEDAKHAYEDWARTHNAADKAVTYLSHLAAPRAQNRCENIFNTWVI
jgi:hypothetical protein